MEKELASLLGVTFEITVKRGILAYLLHSQLLNSHNNQAIAQEIKQWEKITVNKVYDSLIQQLRITDDNFLQWVKDYLRHLLVLGYGLGWTTIRKCVDKNIKSHVIQALWCPLTLPGEQDPRDIERQKTIQKFQAIFDIPGPLTQSELDTGKPGRADFLLWLSPKKNYDYDRIICLEFSLNAPHKLEDFSLEISHCQEMYRYARFIDSRSCFSRICAEVKDDHLTVSKRLKQHLSVFSSKDKPLYKLCQSASYTEQLVKLLYQKNKLTKKCETLAVSVTNNGIETLSAEFNDIDDHNSKIFLMRLMGEIYREKSLFSEAESYEKELQLRIQSILNTLYHSLPKELGNQAQNFVKNQPDFQENLHLTLSEQIKNFSQPMDPIEKSFFLEKIEETPELKNILGDSPRNYLQETWQKLYPDQKNIPLRDAHALVIQATLNKATIEQMQVIALEGNPGIGKTTAVVESLKQEQAGFLFIYVSPRILINRDVTKNLANEEKTSKKSGILTLTTNSKLIRSAPTWYQKQVEAGELPPRHNIEKSSAVVIDGLTNYYDPKKDTLFLTPLQEQTIEDDQAHTKYAGKRSLNDREDEIYLSKNRGVIATLAKATHDLLESNPDLNKVVITLATQGYRQLKQKTTIDSFNKLFKHKVDTKPGKQERQDFAKRIPTIVIMIDEVAGDGAGTLFTHQLAKWLDEQFISPWKSNGNSSSPFRVILIIADASLSNEIVLENFLESGSKDNYVPDKVLISPSQDQCCIRVTGKKLRLSKKPYSTLHLMTNSYPASELHIDYSLRLTAVNRGENKDGKAQTNRQAIHQQEGEAILNNAYSEIARGLQQSAEQIIFFAQDKAFLRKLKAELQSHHPDLSVEIIDQSVPARERYQLINSSRRDTIKVVLMTSSGSRGISFPKADWIIASFPRFSVEASLMEIAQLIYRGRGFYRDPITQEMVSGDKAKRRLVLLINDFLVKNKDDHKDPIALSLQWLRQSSDLITLLMMLRSTIYTRITGDAGLSTKKLAFVPVGYIGNEEMLNSISQEIRDFLRECDVFIKDTSHDPIDKGMIGKASELVKALFKDFTLESYQNLKNIVSYTSYEHLEKFINQVANFSRPLLFINENSHIPENILCIGPYWIEDWSGYQTEEQVEQKVNNTRKDNLESLQRILYGLDKKEIPDNLRGPAKALLQVIKKEKEPEMKEFSTLNKLKTAKLIIGFPLDYPQFLKLPHQADEQSNITRQDHLAHPDLWHGALGRALTAHELVIPVLPYYKRHPWAAVFGSQIVSQLDINFDSRYFMVSNELNLLNMILLDNYEESA